MDQLLEIVVRLTERTLNAEQRTRALFEFADTTGWHPSDALVDLPGTERVANGHLVAEHGLERSAVLSFLTAPATFDDLSHSDRMAILGISYNHLIDWHLFPDRHGLTVVFNRGIPPRSDFIRRSQQQDLWRVESFDAVTGRRPSGNVKALDDALVETVSHWRRALAVEVGTDVPNHTYAALFNGIILLRAVEDNRRHRGDPVTRTIRSIVEEQSELSCEDSISMAMRELRLDRRMKLIREILDELSRFDGVDPRTWIELVRDFYSNRFAPYQYDFSLISKHALSRVYEKYVSVLRAEHSPQLSLFAPLPSEQRETPFGEVYTPQYIARFFARFLKEEMTPREFRSARIVDPACGSGIFLRSLLEMQCDPREVFDLPTVVESAFTNICGTDVDPNACFSTRLSLSLLHLVLTDSLPSGLRITNAEAIEHFGQRTAEHGTYDAVIANPPFVSWDGLTPLMRQRITDLLGEDSKGKIDLYSAFLAIGLDLIRPGGYLMFVVPHSFLLASSTQSLRGRLAETCSIRVLADLSEVPVFEGIGAYVVLLICQKHSEGSPETRPPTVYARVRDFVGRALQSILQRSEQSTPAFDVYEVSGEEFSSGPWLVLPKRQQQLMDRLRTLPTLGELCDVQQGIITGADRILIRKASEIPRPERSIWQPLLRDREMTRYRLPRKGSEVTLYPYLKGKWLSEEDLRERFPDSWAYLKGHREKLELRAPVRRGNCEWWAPAWPRIPDDVYGRPKLLTPYLSITPRFGFDEEGKYAVNRGPMIFARERSDEVSLLNYVVAVLNSTVGFWQIVATSHKYGRGYAKLEKRTLVTIHLPNPASVESRTMREILSLVDERLDGGADDLDSQLDRLVADAFGLKDDDRAEIGLHLE